MSDTEDGLSRIMREFAEKQEAKRAEQERIAAERIERLRASGMSDDQIRVACAVMQEVLDEHTTLVQAEWDRQASKLAAKLKRMGVK